MLKKFYFILFLLCVNQINGQTITLRNAYRNFDNTAYIKAIDGFEKSLIEDNLAEDVKRNIKIKLAFSYRRIKDYNSAERVLREIINTSPNLNGSELEVYLQFAQVLASNGKYIESQENFKKYNIAKGGNDPFVVSTVKLYNNVNALARNSSSYRVEYLGVNTHRSEFSPVMYKDGLVFVTATNDGQGIKRVSSIDNTPFLDLYFVENIKSLGSGLNSQSAIGSSSKLPIGPNYSSKALGSSSYSPETANDTKVVGTASGQVINGNYALEEKATISSDAFSKQLNSKFHDGPVVFFKDYSKVIFTRNSYEKSSNGFYLLKLYMADFIGNDWKNIKELPFNSPEYSTAHPALNKENNILYFTSNMPGGYGGTDIYMVRYDGGSWGTPVNLGAKVNSAGDEAFPFADEQGNLYFSSNGLPGMGDFDFFFVKTSKLDGQPINTPRNLGAPLNSSKDDFGIITDGDRKAGYFSSNRKRGGNDDDIYRFFREGSLYGCAEKIISVADFNTKNSIPFVNLKYELKDLGAMQTVYTDSKGLTKICLDPENEYWITATAEGYASNTIKVSTYNDAAEEEQKIPILLKKQLYVEKAKIPKKVVADDRVVASTKETPPAAKTFIESKIASFAEPSVEDIDTSVLEMVYRGIVTEGIDRTPVENAIVVFRNQCDGTTQQVITKADGVYEFKRELGCDYSVEVLKEKYENVSDSFKKVRVKRRIKPTIIYGTRVFTEGDVVAIDKINYNQDEFKLKRESKREIDKLIATLEKYPTMVVEVRSHTDSRGYNNENLQLSQQRADKVAEYIINKGIDRGRVMARGFGETQLLNTCGDGVQCTEQEHFKNRRTEFKVLSLSKY
jgi:outer membrane protein OmpA-like peptidoglycan-associated protein/tetratricopeptide (TPR) repeat protein